MTGMASDLTDSPMVVVTTITVEQLDACDIDDCRTPAPITVTWTPTNADFGARSTCWTHHRDAIELALDDARDDTDITVELQTVRRPAALAA